MATHRVIVRMQSPKFAIWEAGQLVDYDGQPDWKLEPLDPRQRKAWEVKTAKPDQVEAENSRNAIAGYFREGENTLPPGVDAIQVKRLPPSGWRADL